MHSQPEQPYVQDGQSTTYPVDMNDTCPQPNNSGIEEKQMPGIVSHLKTLAAYIVSPDNHNIANLANLSTIAGVGLSCYGAKHIDEPKGVIAVSIGRTGDILDGKIARLLHQESEAGKILDHTGDKVAMAAILYNAWKKDIGPKSVLASIAAINAANASITLAAKITKPDQELSPSKSGKRFMAFQAMAMGGYMFGEQAKQKHAGAAYLFNFIGHTAAAVSVIYGLNSTSQYARWLKSKDTAAS